MLCRAQVATSHPLPDIKLPFGIRDGTVVHISQVQQGLACGCVCPVCKKPLVARKGAVVVPHFAHYQGAECARAAETALHLEAKRILAERREIWLPEVTVSIGSYGRCIEISPERAFALDEVQAECRTGDVVPDIMARCGEIQLMIEITVTHGVDEAKFRKIRQFGISTIEIDLSSVCRAFSAEDLCDAVIRQTANKQWVFNAKSDAWRWRWRQTMEKLGTDGLRVYGCPLLPQVSRGRPYANLFDDCSQCRFLMEAGEDNQYIICGGQHKVTTRDELLAFENQREG